MLAHHSVAPTTRFSSHSPASPTRQLSCCTYRAGRTVRVFTRAVPSLQPGTFEQEVLKEYAGKLKVIKVELDPHPDLVAQYKVYGLPTLILFKDGQMVEGSKREGAVNKAMLLAYLSKHLAGALPVPASS